MRPAFANGQPRQKASFVEHLCHHKNSVIKHPGEVRICTKSAAVGRFWDVGSGNDACIAGSKVSGVPAYGDYANAVYKPVVEGG